MSSLPPAIWILLGSILTAPLLLFAITVVRVLSAEHRSIRTRTHDACLERFVVVFGAEADLAGPSPELRSRLDHAHQLWSTNSALSILVSGGIARGVDEAVVMKRYLVKRGVPEHSIGEVRPGNTTRATIGALEALGVERALAVSSSYHSHRIRCEGSRRNLTLLPDCPAYSPETTRPATHRAQRFTEVIASWWYALPKAVTSHVDTGPDSLRHRLPKILGGGSSKAQGDQSTRALQSVDGIVGTRRNQHRGAPIRPRMPDPSALAAEDRSGLDRQARLALGETPE